MRKQFKHTLLIVLLRIFQWGISLVPHPWVLALGGFLGGCFHDWVPRERQRAQQSVDLAWPQWSLAERQAFVRRVFQAIGKNAFEFLKMFSMSTRRIARLVEAVEGEENMVQALARGRGVCCLTAHLGNWEILPIFTNDHGWPSAVVAQQLYDVRLDRALNRFREDHQTRVIQRNRVTREIIQCLRQNMLLGILNDQDTDVDSRWAPFFGRPAKTPIGIFRLARKTGAAVVPIFIARQASGKNRIYIEPALDVPTSAQEEVDLSRWAEAANRVIESYVRRFAEQWVWFHERWKHPPPDANAAKERPGDS